MELTVIDFPTVRRHAHRPLSVSPYVLTVATVYALPLSAFAQAAKPVINGRITDKAGRALEGAIISSSANASAVQTNKDGAFTLPAPNSRLVLRVRLRGFKWDSLMGDAAIRYRQDQNQVLANITPTGENTGTSTGGNITSNVQQRTPIDQNYMLGLSGTAAPGPVALDYAASVTQTELLRLNAGDITFRQSGLNMTYDRSDPTTPIINPVGTYPTDPSKFALRTYVVANQIVRGRDYAGQINGKIPFETMGRTSAFQFGAKFRQERRTFDDYAYGRALKTGQTFTLADVAGRYADGSYVNCFPSAQLRLGLNEQTNFRVAVTTGIARPLYYDLAPHTSVTPGVLHGFGIDANATYVQSRSNIEGRVGKPFPRQANWNGNAALTYAKGIVNSRVTMQYNGPFIFTIGDGSRSVATGDT